MLKHARVQIPPSPPNQKTLAIPEKLRRCKGFSCFERCALWSLVMLKSAFFCRKNVVILLNERGTAYKTANQSSPIRLPLFTSPFSTVIVPFSQPFSTYLSRIVIASTFLFTQYSLTSRIVVAIIKIRTGGVNRHKEKTHSNGGAPCENELI